ncbi:MAG: PQQ-dependent sugar dehydrogenase [Candidatus Binatia bacterium]
MKSKILVGLTAAAAMAATPSAFAQLPQPVPEAAAGFAITPLAVIPVPTALAFGPGDEDGPDLYATTLTPGAELPSFPPESVSASGQVVRISLLWTPAGPLATGVSTVATGFNTPLGVVFDDAGIMYVSDSHPGTTGSGRTDGRVTRLDPGVTQQSAGTVIVEGLPNGRHNTNHLRFGPDGRLYMANGNPNDSGCPPDPNTGEPDCVGGDRDLFPYSGAVLSVDAAEVSASPAILHWEDASGTRIDEDDIAADPINADFAAKVNVLAFGFRNVFGVAFAPLGLPFAGTAYTAMNGSDAPPSQDPLFRIDPGTNYGFPFCFNQGTPGGTGANVEVVDNPLFVEAGNPLVCGTVPPATALMGWHVCTTGLDFPTTEASVAADATFPDDFQSSVFVGECTPFFAASLVAQSLADPENARHNTSHKVARVALDDGGNATEVRDFVTGLVLATDVLFGPDGAMYVADAEGILRVAPAGP